MKVYNVYTVTCEYSYDEYGDCCDSYDITDSVYIFLNKKDAEDYIEKFYAKYTNTIKHYIEEIDLIDDYEKFKLTRKDLY